MASLGDALTNVPLRAVSMLVVGVLLGVLLPAAPAHAREGEQPASISASLRYQVTFVARSCDSYADVMANRVRDDRIEAASAPGRGNAYKDGQAVDPAIEAANGGGCTAAARLAFLTGAGQEKKGALSTVTTPAVDSGETVAQVPLLDATGHKTDKRHRRRGDPAAVAGAGQRVHAPAALGAGRHARRPAAGRRAARLRVRRPALRGRRARRRQRAVARLPGRRRGTCSASRTT